VGNRSPQQTQLEIMPKCRKFQQQIKAQPANIAEVGENPVVAEQNVSTNMV